MPTNGWRGVARLALVAATLVSAAIAEGVPRGDTEHPVDALPPPRDVTAFYNVFSHNQDDFRVRTNTLYKGRDSSGHWHMGWAVGKGRHSREHWPGSHPSIRACDVYHSPYSFGYTNHIPRNAYPIKFALAPRYRPGHPFRNKLRKRHVADIVAEWTTVYNATPPASSLLLNHYVETRHPPNSRRHPPNQAPPRKKKPFQGSERLRHIRRRGDPKGAQPHKWSPGAMADGAGQAE